MTPKPKQIVIDKDAFMGINLETLCRFAEQHLVLVSDTLLYECATSTDRQNKRLVDRYERLLKGGAYYCAESSEFIRWEGRSCSPYPWFLAQTDTTRDMRGQENQLEDILTPELTRTARGTSWDLAARMFIDLSGRLNGDMSADVHRRVKELPRERSQRLKIFLDATDAFDEVPQLVEMLLPPGWIVKRKEFCLSSEWMSWHFLRLASTVVREYLYVRQMGGDPGANLAEHDLQDAEYVLLLSRADAILTRDKKLVEPLAKAAFPEKDVFSSLEEVPESYRCDWTSP